MAIENKVVIDPEDLVALREFSERMDRASEDFVKRDQYGHSDLPGYFPWMGPRYSRLPDKGPLSVFRGEGMALFLLARLFKPETILDCFTGTGYAAACLAAGWPEAFVYSIDDYSEGGGGEEAHVAACRLAKILGLENLVLFYADGGDPVLRTAMTGRQATLFLSDGPYDKMAVGELVAQDAVVIRHDDRSGQVSARSLMLLGGSHISVMLPTIEARDTLAAVLGRVFPAEKS